MNALALSLSLPEILARLETQGIFSGDVHKTLSTAARHLPPLQALGQLAPADKQGKVWSETTFARWFAGECGLPFHFIDPLNTDVHAVTQVMSLGFAESHDILAVALDADSVTVAVVDPADTRWVSGLEQVSKRRVLRVLAPPSEIHRHRERILQFVAIHRCGG